MVVAPSAAVEASPAHSASPRRRVFSRTVLVAAAFSLLAAFAPGLPVASASPHIVGIQRISPQVDLVSVYSPSMHRVIRNHVLHPGGKPAGLPSFYMLPGAGGAEDGISWYHNGGAQNFFAGKRVNVVLPIGGKFSMWTDWNAPDPVLGVNKWETYINRELPPVIDAAYRTNRVKALSGVSMTAGPALDIVTHAPSQWRAVASYSGCPSASDPPGTLANTAVVSRGGGNVANMWGPPGSAQWRRHDPIVNAGRLRGTAIYLSAGSGIAGPVDGSILRNGGGFVGGNVIERVSLSCTTNMSDRLNSLRIPHRFVHRRDGVHTWGLFNADLRNSWPMVAGAIGA